MENPRLTVTLAVLLLATSGAHAAFSLSSSDVWSPGDPVRVNVQASHVPWIDLRLYRVQDPRAFFLAQKSPTELVTRERPSPRLGDALSGLPRRAGEDARALARALLRPEVRARITQDAREQAPEPQRRAPPAPSPRPRIPPLAAHPLIAQWRLDLGPDWRTWTYRSIDLPVRQAGIYLVEGIYEDQVATVAVVVSGLRFVAKRSPEEMLLWVVDAKTGAPIDGARVLVGHYARGLHKLAEGTTAKDGLVSARTDARWPASGELFYLVEARGDTAVTNLYTEGFGGEEGARGYVFTDRPVYRPGQQVHLKIVARRDGPKGYELPARGTELTVTVEDPRGETMATLRLPLGDLGTAHGSLALGEEAPLGRYSVQARAEGLGEMSGFFKVEEYKKPEFEVKVTPASPHAIAGGKASFAVEGRYYFGEPVKGALVTWSLYRMEHVRPWWAGLEYGWYWAEQDDGWGWEKVQDGEGKLDGAGKLRVSVATDKGLDRTFLYRLEALVTDATRRTISGSGQMKVAPAEIELGVEADAWGYAKGDAIRVTVTAVDLNGSPRAANVTLSLWHRRWEKVGERWEETKTKLEDRAVKVSDDGRALATLLAEAPGTLEIVATAQDAQRRTARAEHTVWVYGGDLGWRSSAAQIQLDKKSYAPGDTLTALVSAPVGDGHALVTVEGRGIVRREVARLRGGSAAVKMELSPEWSPNVDVQVVAVSEGRFYQASREVALPPLDKFLELSIATDKPSYLPGEPIQIAVVAKDHAQRPVDAEIAVAVVDEAIYAISPEIAPDIRRAFYQRREVQVSTRTSDQWYHDAPAVSLTELYDVMRSPKGKQAEARVRKDFRDTLLWSPAVRTGTTGEARLTATAPDNLTAFRITARAVTADTRVGQATEKFIVRKNLLLRVETPRFFRARDKLLLAAVVHNYLPEPAAVTLTLGATGLSLDQPGPLALEVPAGGEKRVDYAATVTASSGEVVLTGKALSSKESDALELRVPALGHGLSLTTSDAGVLRENDRIARALTLPESAEPGSAQLTVEVSQSVAGAVLSSLDYLVGYPYGCVEQTMSRFLPDLVASAALQKLGVPPRHPDLPKMIAAGVSRLVSLQHEDGGWGWWTDDDTNPFMTAYVVFGLSEARRQGYSVPAGVLSRGLESLRAQYARSERMHPTTRAYMLWALAAAGEAPVDMVRAAFEKRSADLNPYALSLLARALMKVGDMPRAEKVEEELLARATRDAEGVRWAGQAWHYTWEDDAIETTASSLHVVLHGGPKLDVADEAVRWLLAQRQGNHWSSTRDTAAAVMALVDYLEVSRPAAGETEVSLSLNGSPLGSWKFAGPDALGVWTTLVTGEPLGTGSNEIGIARRGAGAVRWTATLSWRTSEEDVAPASAGFTVERGYALLVPEKQKDRSVWRPAPLASGAAVKTGQVLRVTTRIQSAEEREYVMLEDPLPAGFEVVREDALYEIAGAPAAAWSDYEWFAAREVRDEKVGFFARWLPAGKTEFSYLLRAQIPGEFHVMPAEASLMYYPRVRGSSAEMRISVQEPAAP